MGFGTDINLPQLKREAARLKAMEAQVAQLKAEVIEQAGRLALVQRLIDRNRVAVPTNYLRCALGPTNRCAGCLSAYSDCPVHS